MVEPEAQETRLVGHPNRAVTGVSNTQVSLREVSQRLPENLQVSHIISEV
jgi:hypothetical protein